MAIVSVSDKTSGRWLDSVHDCAYCGGGPSRFWHGIKAQPGNMWRDANGKDYCDPDCAEFDKKAKEQQCPK